MQVMDVNLSKARVESTRHATGRHPVTKPAVIGKVKPAPQLATRPGDDLTVRSLPTGRFFGIQTKKSHPVPDRSAKLEPFFCLYDTGVAELEDPDGHGIVPGIFRAFVGPTGVHRSARPADHVLPQKGGKVRQELSLVPIYLPL